MHLNGFYLKIIFTYIAILIFSVTNAQQSYYEEWYSAELENIPQNSIKSIVPDKYGFIWMTTENGLLRFDGKNFKVFNSGNSDLVSNRFAYITGNIKNDSLQTHTGYYEDEVLINNRTISRRNNLKNNPKFKSVESYEDLLYYNNSLNDFKIDFRNTKITCTNGDYYLIGITKITKFNKNGKKLKEVKKVCEESMLYFLQNDELILLNYKKNQYSLFKNEFSKIYLLTIPQKAKIIYNPTVQQLFVYNKNEILILNNLVDEFYLVPIFFKKNININIKSMYFDQTNNKLFIGTLDKGLNIISTSLFKILVNPKNANNNYYANFPISNDEFVTSKGEIFKNNKIIRDLKIVTADNNYSITVDHKKNIWINIENKIVKYLKKTNYKTTKTYSFDYRTSIFCDSENKIWIGMDRKANKSAKLLTIDANKENAKPVDLVNIHKPVKFITENPNKELFFVTENEILIYNTINRKWKRINSGNNEIRSIFIAKDNSVWACTYNNGFSLLKNNKLYKMPYDNKMYLSSAHCIKEDKIGHFWISTNKGLIEVSKKSLLNYHKNKTPVYYHHYTVKDGFLTNEFNGGCQPCATELNNDYLFPSLNGIVLFNPEKVKKILPSNNFFINEINLDGTTHIINDKIVVPRNINRIKFNIDFPYFGNQDNVSFDVKFDISDNADWVTVTNQEISYTNLPPGTHTFYVRKIKPFTSDYEIKKITVEVPFLFYEKLWFTFLVTLLILALIMMAVKLRLRHISNRNLILEELIKERTSDLFETVSSLNSAKNSLSQKIFQQKKLIGAITHDIKSPLKFLTITAKHVYDKSVVAENETLIDNAKVMQESAAELYRFVDNLVDYSKVFIEQNVIKQGPKEDVDTIIREKITLFKNLANENKTTINYKIHTATQINLNKKVVGIIIHNLLDNAIKNTFNGTILIETKLLENKVFLSVEDTGLGMAQEITAYYNDIQNNYGNDKPEVKTYGLGLHMVVELLNLVDGTIQLNSKVGEGTKVTVIFETH